MSEEGLQAGILKAFRLTIINVVLNNNRIAERLGCNPSDLQVLHAIELGGALTPKELAERAGLTSGGITVVLDRLEKEGIIKREKNPHDRRSLLVNLNPGPRLDEIHAAYEVYAENMLNLLSKYGPDELQTILKFLGEINGSPE